MSTDPSKKRKDKKKKKAMLEALQQEEYQEERAHVQQLEDVDEDFIVYPADDSDDTAPLLEESDGSGACAKIVFLVLLSSLGMAIGVIFFEMGGMQTLTGLMDVESIINAPPVKYDPPTTPVDVAIDDDFDQIDPSPIEPESLKDDKSDVIAEAVEAVKDLPVEVIETVTETVVVPEVVVKEIEEVIVEEPVVEEPVVEAEIVEQQTVETEAVEPVVQPTESVPEPIEELPVETVAEAVEEAIVVSENFESQLEDELAEVPQESFTMRAEREAVQGAVDEVWVMTVRCIEELRALQVMAKSSLTHAVIDSISQRLEPLRSQLDGLVKNTSDSVFDGALEQAAELERNLRAVLGELDEARNQDTILAEEEAARQEQLAAEAAEIVNEEPEEVMAEVQEEEKVEINEEPIQGEVEIEEQEVESLHEPVNEAIPEPVETLTEVVHETEVEILPEPEIETTAESILETLPETPSHTIVESIPDSEEKAVELIPESTVDSSTESVVETEPESQVVVIEDVIATEPNTVVESIADSEEEVIELIPESTVDSSTESVVETEPEAQVVVTEDVIATEPDTVVESIPDSVENVVELIPEPALDSSTESIVETEPESQVVVEDVIATQPDTVVEPIPDSVDNVVELIPEPAADSLTDSVVVTEPETLPEPQVVSFEDVIAAEPELEVAAPEMVEEESQAETVPEAEVKEEVIAEEPEIEVAPEIFEEVGQVEADQPIVEEATNVPEIIEDSVEEPEENVEQELIENVIEPELEIATPEVFEEEAQADQPTVDVVFNEVAEETVPETVESAEEQIIDAPAPEATPESDYRFLSEVEEEQEVEEPLQVATEAFVVEPEVEQVAVPVAESVKDAPSRMQNLEEADRLVDQSPAQALALMEQILEKDPLNALGLYGRARSLDSLAEVERSNARLEQSVFAYRAVLDLEDQVDDQLYLKAALRCIDRMRFRGFHGKAIRIQQRLVARFPNDIQYQNQLAVGFLLTNQPEAARTILEGVLERWPKSGFAQVHLGFILKTTFEDYDAGARWMMAGIASREEGVIDGRFYSHLGDALTRLGKHQEAQRVYLDGEKEGVFLSHQQRSLYNVDRLTGKPWWDKESTTYGHFFDLLEANWRQIRNEGVALLTLEAPEGFADESEKLRDSGDWKQYELFAQGRKNAAHCTKAPVTCTLIENYPPALCKRGQVKFSIMHPGTHVWPHTGPTNCRIRAHLGLVVPGGAQLRVGNTTDTWEEGKFIIFDDSFEHEVWHKGSSYRLVLIVDLWHPELTAEEWRSLAPI
ncbi:titin-like isoform X1 [Daphnia pulex]|uniref:titin-like isoform X1 n=1 Tax=Daphnia pulex TaxID=6669 RepID=UPI001EDE6D1A|nr:titin-like isoform X1 [Daphnia pulex]